MHLLKEGTEFFRSERTGALCGFALGALAHGQDVRGATLQCRLLTKSLAKLAVAAGVCRIEAEQATRQAIVYLDAREPWLTYSSISEVDDCSEQIEHALLSDGQRFDEQALLDRVAGKALQMLEHHLVPADALLTQQFGYRLGSGGGGT